MQKSNSKQSSFSNENNKTQEMKTFRMQTGSTNNATISKRQFSLLRNKYSDNDLRNNNFDGTTSIKTTYSTDDENENFGYKNFGDQNSDQEYESQEEYEQEDGEYDENNHFHKFIHIEDLPDDILFLIFLFLLGSKDRRNICMDITLVCKKWASVLLDDRFWRQACISYRVPFDTTPGFILFTNQQRQLQQQFVENNILNASSSPSSFPFNFSDSKANVLSHRFHSTTDLTNIQQYSRPPRMNQIVKVQSDFPPRIESSSYQEYSYSSTSNNNTNVNFGSSTYYSSNNSPVSTSSSSSNNEPTSPMPPIPKNNSSAVNSSLNQSKRKTSTPNIFSPIPNTSSPIQDDNDYFDDDKSVESQFSQESDPNYSNSRRIRKRRDSFFRDIFMENRYHKCWASEKVVDFLNSKAYNLRNHEIGYTKLYYCYPFIILGFLREFQFYLYPKFGDGYDDYQQKYFRDLLQYSKKLPPEAEEASQNPTDSPSVPSANDENIDENFSFGNSQESTTNSSSSSFHQSSSKSGIPNFTDELMLNHICTFTCIDPVVKLDVDYREEINETNIVAFTSGGFELFTLPKDKANLDYKYRKGGLQNIDLNANVGDASLVPIPCNAGRIDFGEYTQDDIAIVHTMAGKIFALFKLSREDPSIVSGPHVRIWDFNTRKLLHRVPLPPNKIVFGLEPWNARELFDFKGSNKVGAIADIVGKVVYLLDLATLDWATIESPKGEPSFVRTNGNSVLIFGADAIRARAKSSAFLDLWSYKPLNNSSKNNNKNTTNNTGTNNNNNNNNISITINNNSTANTNNETSASGNQSNININITVANTNPNSNITITNTTTTTTTSISSSTTFVNPPPPPSSQNQPFVKECILSLEYEHIIAAHVDANRVYVLLKPYSKNTIYLDIWDNSDGSFVCRVKSFDDVNGFFDKRDFDKKYIRIMKSDERNLYYYVIQFKPNIGSILSIRQIASIPLYCLPSKELQPHQPIHQVEESFKRKYSLPGLAGLAQFISPQTPNNNIVANLKKDRSRSFSIKFAPRPEERGRRASIISTEGL